MSNGINLILKSGEHDRALCPVNVTLDAKRLCGNRDPKSCGIKLIESDTNQEVDSQLSLVGKGETVKISWILGRLEAGKERKYQLLCVDKAPFDAHSGVESQHSPKSHIDIKVKGDLFTRYRLAENQYRPYFYPLIGPKGREVTEEAPSDHKHHRSLYVAYGEVNGADCWAEGAKSGKVLHREFLEVIGGSVFATISAKNDWLDNSGQKLLTEYQSFIIYNLPETGRIIEADIKFSATEGEVHFGDTKEGGIISVRVAPAIKVTNGGRIENSYGGTNERETWGKRAHWCDYSGVIDNVELGITVYDHVKNPRYPTYWHVRNYGLMTTNIFGSGTFENDKRKDGSYTLKGGEELEFLYRVYIHAGNATGGKVAQKYHDFINPPGVEVI